MKIWLKKDKLKPNSAISARSVAALSARSRTQASSLIGRTLHYKSTIHIYAELHDQIAGMLGGMLS